MVLPSYSETPTSKAYGTPVIEQKAGNWRFQSSEMLNSHRTNTSQNSKIMALSEHLKPLVWSHSIIMHKTSIFSYCPTRTSYLTRWRPLTAAMAQLNRERNACGHLQKRLIGLPLLNKLNQLDVTLWKFFVAQHVSNVITFILRSWWLCGCTALFQCVLVYWCG